MKTAFSFTCLFIVLFFSTSSVYGQNIALNFDGVDDYVSTSTSGITGNGPRTIEAWIQTTKNSLPPSQGGNGQSTIVDWGTFVNTGRSTFNVLWSNAIRFEVGGNGLSGTIPVNDGQWHHVAMTYNPISNPTVYLYVDGVLDVSGNLTVPVNTGSAQNITFGRRVDGVNLFEGGIDEVRVYNFAKTLAEINADRLNELCGSYDPGLIAYFKFDEGIPNAINSSNDSALNYVNFSSATLNSFDLTGTSSNWITGPAIARGNSYSTVAAAVCGSLTSPSGNFVWTSNGTYRDTLVNSVLCDSIVTVELEILQSDSSYAVVACDSFVSASGNVYTSSGTYLDTLFNASFQGCDSVIQIQLFVDNGSITMVDTSGCDSVNFNGMSYFTSTSFSDTLSNVNGCDSIVQVNIVVTPSFSRLDSLYGCDSLFFNGTWFFSDQQVSDNYSSATGCDSTITTYVFINRSVITADSLFACDSLNIDGVWYDSTQIITSYDTTSAGCDSVHSTYLTITNIDLMASQSGGWEVVLNTIPGASYLWFDCLDSSLVDTFSTFYAPYVGVFYAEVTLGNCLVTTDCYNLGEGVNDIFDSNFELYPNPNSGSFIIKFVELQAALNIQIIDFFGRIVIKKDLENIESFTLHTNLESGVYFLVGRSEKANFAKPFVVR